MRLCCLLLALSVILGISVKAQNNINLDEAINLAYQNNFNLQKNSAKIKNAESNLDGSARLPNPIFTYFREDLESNSLKYNEWVASGSGPPS